MEEKTEAKEIPQYDDIVVGAGPSGSQCAYTLAKKGVRVLILDKKNSGWQKPCGGGISKKTFNDFEIPISIGYKTAGIKFIVDGKTTQTKISFFDVYRNSFDEWLSKRAVDSGAVMLFGITVTDVEHDDGWYVVDTTKGVFKSRFLIGADGVYSTIRKKIFNTDLNQKMLAFALDYLYEGPHKVRSLDFYTDELLPFGYGYIFPKDDNNIIVGIAGLDIQNPKEIAEKFIEKYKDQIVGLKYVGFKGAHIPYQHLKEIRNENCFLVGDSAGLNTPVAFAGIPIALRSGRLAANTIIEFLETANPKALEKYSIETLRKQSASFSSCHDYWDYLVKNKKQPKAFSLAKKYLTNPKRFAASMIYCKWLNVLTKGMPLEQLDKFKD